MKDNLPQISFLKEKQKKHLLGFDIITLEDLFSRHGNFARKPHRIDFYHILYISQGSGNHYVDFRLFPLAAGDLLFIFPGQVHAFAMNQKNTRGFLILFTEEFFTDNLSHTDFLFLGQLRNYHLHSPLISPPEEEKKTFAHHFQEMVDEFFDSNDVFKKKILRLQLKLLLLKAERLTLCNQPAQKHIEWLNRFMKFHKLLEKYYPDTRNAVDYAGMMKMSYKNLNTLCKAISGKTAKKYIDQYIILEIKRYLASTDIAIKKLAWDFGFDEPTNLVKYFKKHTGQSPSRFRQLLTK